MVYRISVSIANRPVDMNKVCTLSNIKLLKEIDKYSAAAVATCAAFVPGGIVTVYQDS